MPSSALTICNLDNFTVSALRKTLTRTPASRIAASLAIASLTTLIASASQAASIANGNFETGTFADWTTSGAVVIASDGDFRTFAGAVGAFPIGIYVAVFGGADLPATGALSQVIDTTAGQQYLLKFDYGRYQSPDCCAGAQTLTVTAVNVANGTTVGSLGLTDASGNNELATVFSPYLLSFVASGSFTRLSFTDQSAFTISTDGILDNISITAIPELATYFLMSIGLVSIALARRHTRAAQSS